MLHNRARVRLSTAWLISAVLLAGCTTTPVSSQNDDNLMGKNISFLYQQWGEPDYRSATTGEENQLHIWDINGCMNNVTTRADGTIAGFAETGDCDVFQRR